MRIESSVTAISWIPSEAIRACRRSRSKWGVGHYDEPPPDRLEEGDLERLRDADRFREANQLKAWIEVEDGSINAHGYAGEGLVGSTTFRLGRKELDCPRRRFRDASARTGGFRGRGALRPDRRRAGRLPSAAHGQGKAVLPHPVRDRLDDTCADDPRRRLLRSQLVGASPFPRHWIYDVTVSSS